MNDLEKALYKTRKSVFDFASDLSYNNCSVSEIEQCSHCGIWLKYKELVKDLDQNLICKFCLQFEGM